MCDCVSAKITAIDYAGVTSATGLFLRTVLPRFIVQLPRDIRYSNTAGERQVTPVYGACQDL